MPAYLIMPLYPDSAHFVDGVLAACALSANITCPFTIGRFTFYIAGAERNEVPTCRDFPCCCRFYSQAACPELVEGFSHETCPPFLLCEVASLRSTRALAKEDSHFPFSHLRNLSRFIGIFAVSSIGVHRRSSAVPVVVFSLPLSFEFQVLS